MTEEEQRVLAFSSAIDSLWDDSEQAPAVLYHYTNEEAARGILTNNSVWATHVYDMKDQEEIRIGEATITRAIDSLRAKSSEQLQATFLQGLLNEIERLGPTRQPGAYVWSLTPRKDESKHWRQYAAGGQGVALGFCFGGQKRGKGRATDSNGQVHEFEMRLVKCQYSETDVENLAICMIDCVAKSYAEFVATHPQLKPVANRVAGIHCMNLAAELAASLKAKSFAWEKEWRLYTFVMRYNEVLPCSRGTSRGSVRYLPLTGFALGLLTEICIGPGYHDDLLKHYLDRFMAETGATSRVRIVQAH